MLGKYYIREKFTYWFYCFFPLILLDEVIIWARVNAVADEDTWEMIEHFLLPLALLASGIMILIQIISCLVFLFSTFKLTREQRRGLREAARNSKKTGRILQSDEVLIYYGMYLKRIIFKDKIRSMESHKSSSVHRSGRGGSIIMDENIIWINGGQDVLMCPMKVLDGYAGEMPWSCMIFAAWVGIAMVAFSLYPQIMNLFMNENDLIEKCLFYAGYEWMFWLGVAVLLAALWFVALWLKNKYVDDSYKGMRMQMTTFWFYLAAVTFAWITLDRMWGDSDIARRDLYSYKKGYYEQAVGYGTNIYEPSYGGETVMKDSIDCGTIPLYDFMVKEGIEHRIMYCKLEDESGEFLFVVEDMVPELEQNLKLTYLENTRIVVEVEEID